MYPVVEAFWWGETRISLRRTDCRPSGFDLKPVREGLVLVWSTFGESSALYAVLLWDCDISHQFETRQKRGHRVVSPFFVLFFPPQKTAQTDKGVRGPLIF